MKQTSNSRRAMKPKQLDQFYTKPQVAAQCWRTFQTLANRLGVDERRYWFVEPSAGCGCFYQNLPPRRRIGLDLAPQQLPNIRGRGIIQADYFDWTPPTKRASNRRYIVIGNPPFGKRGKLAIDFFNHSNFADIIAFIVPVIFRKYAVHRHLSANYALVKCKNLDNDSFCTPDNKPYSVNAEFQIWTRRDILDIKTNRARNKLIDLRESAPPPIQHDDFEMRQYNNTAEALPAFKQPFDFAVPCQGYQDYSRRETDPRKCEKHKQWMLFVAKNKRVRARLNQLDFDFLAHECATATPGFRKNDVVRCYVKSNAPSSSSPAPPRASAV